MQRVMIVGGPGSGKSTLAGMLGDRTGLPVFHMDHIHWKENWVHRPMAEKIPLVKAVVAQDAWVFEGGMSTTYGERMARADTLIWLDLPVTLRLWRVTKRLFRDLGRARPDLPDGCVERLHPETLAFFRFVWTTRIMARTKVLRLMNAAPATVEIVHLRNPAEVREWLMGML